MPNYQGRSNAMGEINASETKPLHPEAKASLSYYNGDDQWPLLLWKYEL